MARKIINTGATPNDNTGDTLRDAFSKVNDNFTELYSTIGADVQIPVQTNNGGKYLTTNGTTLSWATVTQGGSSDRLVSGNKNVSLSSEGKLTLPAGTTYEYLSAPLTGHGDGLARLDFSLATDGVIAQWMSATASPAGSGYSPGDTFTFDEEFLGIPGASVTIEVLTVGPGGSVGNLAFTPPPLYPADIYRDSPINLQVGSENNRWTFGADGKLTLPGRIIFPNGTASIYGNADLIGLFPSPTSSSGLEIASGVSSNLFNAGNVVITSNQEQVGGTKTWTFDTAGYLNLPGGTSSIFSSANNVVIDANGYPGSSRLELSNNTVQLVSEQEINLITAGGAGGQWTFGTDGSITLPADPSTPVLTIEDVVPTPRIYRATDSNDPVAIKEAYNLWYSNEEAFKVMVEQDEMVRGSNYPWHGMPSWEAYPLILNWNGGGLPPSSSLPPTAKTAMDSYFAWKELESNIDIVSGNKTFSFENTGSLLLPGELTFGDAANAKIVVGKAQEATWTFGGDINPHALTWPDGSWQSSAFQGTATTAGGLRNENDATVTVDPLGNNKVWTFSTDGDLTLPQSSEVKVTGITAASLDGLETDYNAAEVLYNNELTNWMTLNSHTPVWYLLPGRDAYGALARGDYDGAPWVGTEALIVRASAAATAYSAWQTAVDNSKLTVKSDTAAWTFDSTNKLTLPKGGVVAGGDTYDIQVAYTAWQADQTAWNYVITTGGADTNIRPWNFAGPSREEKQAVVTAMWQTQQNLNPGGTLGWVPISSALYNEVRSWLAVTVNQDGYENWKKLTTAVNITSENKTWSFTNDGSLTLGNGVALSGAEGNVFMLDSTTVSAINLRDENDHGFYTDVTGLGILSGAGTAFYFDNAGVLKLPSNGDIVDSNSVSVLGREPKFELKTQTFEAVAGHRYAVDNGGFQIGVNLPANPAVGDAVYFVDAMGTFGPSAYLTMNGNGKQIMGTASQQITTPNESIGVFYNGTEWRFYS